MYIRLVTLNQPGMTDSANHDSVSDVWSLVMTLGQSYRMYELEINGVWQSWVWAFFGGNIIDEFMTCACFHQSLSLYMYSMVL